MALPPTSIPGPVLKRAASALRVLAHPDRLRLVELLLAGRSTVGKLARQVRLAPSAVSQHLSFLRAQGILDSRRDGRVVYYRVVSPEARTLLGCIRRHAGSRGSPP